MKCLVHKFLLFSFEITYLNKIISGDVAWMVPPVPIPNTAVKHPKAESTCLETDWEDRKLPVKRRLRISGVFFVSILQIDDFSEAQKIFR